MSGKKKKILFFTLAACVVLGFFLFIFSQKELLASTVAVLKWGWVGNSAKEGTGAVSLMSFTSDNTGTTPEYGITVETDPNSPDCQNNKCGIRGFAWLGTEQSDSGVQAPIGWLQFADLGDIKGVPAFANESPYWDPGTKQVHGWARLITIHQYGQNNYGQDDWGWVRLDGTDYGVYFDPLSQRFSGWAWSGNGTSDGATQMEGSGLGWIQFDMIISPKAGGVPYLEVQQGDVYSQGEIRGTAGTPSQATYLILAGGDIVNFQSEQANPEYEQTNVNSITYPTRNVNAITEAYVSNIGLIQPEYLSGGKLGYPTMVLPLQAEWTGPIGAMDNTVYSNNGAYIQEMILDDPITITHETGKSGNGTVVVYGDLYINNNINYLPTPSLADVNELPSVAWIVQGDIYIDPSVRTISGVFIALGNDALGTSGVIHTGDSDVPLTVYGAMIAHQFDFERQGVGEYGSAYPAEKIYYDGRLIANPPPGLQDLAETLPDISDIEE